MNCHTGTWDKSCQHHPPDTNTCLDLLDKPLTGWEEIRNALSCIEELRRSGNGSAIVEVTDRSTKSSVSVSFRTVAELAAPGKYRELPVKIEPLKCWRCGMDIPTTEDRCMNCHAAASGRTLQEDVREKGELEKLKFELENIETLLAVLVEALAEDPMLKKRIDGLARKGVPPFIDLLEPIG